MNEKFSVCYALEKVMSTMTDKTHVVMLNGISKCQNTIFNPHSHVCGENIKEKETETKIHSVKSPQIVSPSSVNLEFEEQEKRVSSFFCRSAELAFDKNLSFARSTGCLFYSIHNFLPKQKEKG